MSISKGKKIFWSIWIGGIVIAGTVISLVVHFKK